MALCETKRRLKALEQQHQPPAGMRIIIAPFTNGPEQLPVAGWEAGDIVTMRLDGETEDACWERHSAAIDAQHGPAATVLSIQLIEGDDP